MHLSWIITWLLVSIVLCSPGAQSSGKPKPKTITKAGPFGLITQPFHANAILADRAIYMLPGSHANSMIMGNTDSGNPGSLAQIFYLANGQLSMRGFLDRDTGKFPFHEMHANTMRVGSYLYWTVGNGSNTAHNDFVFRQNGTYEGAYQIQHRNGTIPKFQLGSLYGAHSTVSAAVVSGHVHTGLEKITLLAFSLH